MFNPRALPFNHSSLYSHATVCATKMTEEMLKDVLGSKVFSTAPVTKQAQHKIHVHVTIPQSVPGKPIVVWFGSVTKPRLQRTIRTAEKHHWWQQAGGIIFISWS